MKLNNKGLTVVELILSFTLLIVLVFGMFNVVVEIKDYSETKELEKDLVEFKNRIIYKIQNDLITGNIKDLEIQNTGTTPILKITMTDGTTKTLEINLTKKEIKYDDETYKIPHSNLVEFLDSRVINLCPGYPIDEKDPQPSNEEDCKKSAKWIGKVSSYQNVTITNDKVNKVLTIDVPYYEIDGTKNHGFKIIHPYGNLE